MTHRRCEPSHRRDYLGIELQTLKERKQGDGEDSILIGVRSRDPPSVVASATSSNASVATNASTSALLGIKVKKYLRGHHKMDKMTQKELNILLAGQPGLEPGDKKTTDVDVEQPSATVTTTESSEGTHGPILKQVLAALAVSLCSLVVGFASAYTAPALASMNSPNSTLHITDAEASWIGSLMPLSALFGGICGGPLIENLGRRNTILSTGLPFSLSFLLISFATNVGMVMGGRSLAGFCVGISSLALPVYLGETVEPRVRGTLGLLPTSLGNLGILLAFIAGAFLNWSDLALLGAILPLPYFVCTFFVPETPGWYVSRGNDKKAQQSLQWLRGRNVDISVELAQFNKSHKDIEHHDTMTTLKELFSKRYYWPFCISLGLMFFQQFSGINAVIFYTVTIFRDAGSTIDSNLSSIIVGIVNLISTMLATVLIDKLGRKILLYISNTLMAITLGVLGTFFYFKSTGMDMTPYGWVPLPAFMVFVFGFAVGAGPIPWLMMGEILPAQVRGTAASIVTAFNWSCTFVVTKTFVDMSKALGAHSPFFLFSIICIFGLVFVVKSVPETKGKSLEDIERNLVPGVSKVSMRSLARIPSLAYLKPFPSVY